MKNIKYLCGSIGIIIFIWVSYGFYLYINLTPVEINNADITLDSFSVRQNKSELPTNPNPDTILRSALSNNIFSPENTSLLPKERLFHNNKRYGILFPQLFASSVVFFEKFFSPQHSLCIDGFNSPTPLKTKMLFTPIALGDFIGFKSIIDYRESILTENNDVNLQTLLSKQNNFPLTMQLIKGDLCNKNIVSEHILTLDYQDSIEAQDTNYPFDIHNRTFVLKIREK